jgi:hypothetical protein
MRHAVEVRGGMASRLKKRTEERLLILRHGICALAGRQPGSGWRHNIGHRLRRRPKPFEMQLLAIDDALVGAPQLHRDVSAADEALRRADRGIGQFARHQVPTAGRRWTTIRHRRSGRQTAEKHDVVRSGVNQ